MKRSNAYTTSKQNQIRRMVDAQRIARGQRPLPSGNCKAGDNGDSPKKSASTTLTRSFIRSAAIIASGVTFINMPESASWMQDISMTALVGACTYLSGRIGKSLGEVSFLFGSAGLYSAGAVGKNANSDKIAQIGHAAIKSGRVIGAVLGTALGGSAAFDYATTPPANTDISRINSERHETATAEAPLSGQKISAIGGRPAVLSFG